MEPSKRLDYVMEKIKIWPNPNQWRRLDQLVVHVIDSENDDELSENANQLGVIITKLLKDEMISLDRQTTGRVEMALIKLTFEGEVLLEMEGGYSGRLEKENRASVSEKRNALYLRHGAVWAAVFAGCLLIWEVIKFLLDKGSVSRPAFVAYLFLLLLSSLVYQLVKKFP